MVNWLNKHNVIIFKVLIALNVLCVVLNAFVGEIAWFNILVTAFLLWTLNNIKKRKEKGNDKTE